MDAKKELLDQYFNLQLKYVEFEKYIKNMIENLLIEKGIKYQNLTSRVKNAKSLDGKLEKDPALIRRLKNNIQNINDLCGIRIVLYDNQQFGEIYELINGNFNIISYTNKRYDYNSNNITVELKSNVYKNFRCEIQLVTVMSHNLIEIGHDIIYKDINRLKEKDEFEYNELHEEYKKCLEEVYKLETRIDGLKRRKDNIIQNYSLLNEIFSDKYIKAIDNNKSNTKFYSICNDIMSIASYLSRNTEKIEEFYKKQIILKLVKNLLKEKESNYIFSEEFVFDNFLKVFTTYYNIWIEDYAEVLDILVKYIKQKNNNQIEKEFFDSIKIIINKDIKNKHWIVFESINKWILKDNKNGLYKVKMINAIVQNNLEYTELVDSRTFNIHRDEILYNDKGKEKIKELFIYACNLFLENQSKIIYDELISITYKFEFLANEILDYFYNNYEKIHDIYRYDLLRKIYYSFNTNTLNSKYYERIKEDKFYSMWKYLCYDYFDEDIERKNREQIAKLSQRKINSYIKNINTISLKEIRRIIKNYNELVKEKIYITDDLRRILYLIGKKYDKALSIYENNKNEYLYLGLRNMNKDVKKREDIKVLKAVKHIFERKVFEEYLKSKNSDIQKDIIICNIIMSNKKLYSIKKKKNELFRIINNYNRNRKSLLYNQGYLNPDFLKIIEKEECNQILNNYFICIYNKNNITELGINLYNIFELFPDECREFFEKVINEEKTRKFEFRNCYIYEAKNYEIEREKNVKLLVDLLKEYHYYDVYHVFDSIIKVRDEKLIEDLSNIVNQTTNKSDLKSIAILISHIELGVDIWTIVKKILLKTSDKEVEKYLFEAMYELGVVNSLYEAYKNRKEQIEKIIEKETNSKSNVFFKKLCRSLKSSMEIAELNEKRRNYEVQIQDEKYKKNIE